MLTSRRRNTSFRKRDLTPKYEPEIVKVNDGKEPELSDPIIDRLREEHEQDEKKQIDEAKIIRMASKTEKEREAARLEIIKKFKDKPITFDFDGKPMLINNDVEIDSEPLEPIMSYDLSHPPSITTRMKIVIH